MDSPKEPKIADFSLSSISEEEDNTSSPARSEKPTERSQIPFTKITRKDNIHSGQEKAPQPSALEKLGTALLEERLHFTTVGEKSMEHTLTPKVEQQPYTFSEDFANTITEKPRIFLAEIPSTEDIYVGHMKNDVSKTSVIENAEISPTRSTAKKPSDTPLADGRQNEKKLLTAPLESPNSDQSRSYRPTVDAPTIHETNDTTRMGTQSDLATSEAENIARASAPGSSRVNGEASKSPSFNYSGLPGWSYGFSTPTPEFEGHHDSQEASNDPDAFESFDESKHEKRLYATTTMLAEGATISEITSSKDNAETVPDYSRNDSVIQITLRKTELLHDAGSVEVLASEENSHEPSLSTRKSMVADGIVSPAANEKPNVFNNVDDNKMILDGGNQSQLECDGCDKSQFAESQNEFSSATTSENTVATEVTDLPLRRQYDGRKDLGKRDDQALQTTLIPHSQTTSKATGGETHPEPNYSRDAHEAAVEAYQTEADDGKLDGKADHDVTKTTRSPEEQTDARTPSTPVIQEDHIVEAGLNANAHVRSPGEGEGHQDNVLCYGFWTTLSNNEQFFDNADSTIGSFLRFENDEESRTGFVVGEKSDFPAEVSSEIEVDKTVVSLNEGQKKSDAESLPETPDGAAKGSIRKERKGERKDGFLSDADWETLCTVLAPICLPEMLSDIIQKTERINAKLVSWLQDTTTLRNVEHMSDITSWDAETASLIEEQRQYPITVSTIETIRNSIRAYGDDQCLSLESRCRESGRFSDSACKQYEKKCLMCVKDEKKWKHYLRKQNHALKQLVLLLCPKTCGVDPMQYDVKKVAESIRPFVRQVYCSED
ncbi:hypothetical protein AB6A40_004399 [Gnathostoma spinigerum]|uniref:Uncharacterized protein n=1 Tax=Gnathostoma spinigerum TaxID=75299 RepID=A0ABD6ECE0_9BILA